MSASDAIADFIGFMEANGVVPVEPIAQRLGSGNLIRFRCDGDGKGRLNGWAILYLDERPAGAFGNYRLNTGTLKWKASDDRPALTQAERDGLQREWREAREKREGERQANERQAALDASEMWQRAKPATADHGYIARKLIDPTPLRQLGSSLLVPMFDSAGLLWNLQRIAPDGEKRFLRGGRVVDLFCLIGEFKGATQASLGEGYATMDAAHQATGMPCVVTFSTKNLPRVARIFAERRPDLNFIIVADDDSGLAERRPDIGNVGKAAAEATAAEIGARIVYPRGRAA
jgi:putative DNA primase/helicase